MKRLLYLVCFILFVFLPSCRQDASVREADESELYAGEILFRYVPETGSTPGSVYLTGDFNDWMPRDIDYLMELRSDGAFELPVVLDEGRYGFRFVIDGSWVIDMQNEISNYSPEAHEYEENSFGAFSAVIFVTKPTNTNSILSE